MTLFEELLKKAMEIEIPAPPKFEKGMSMTKYLRAVDEYAVLKNRKKYNIALTFVKMWLAGCDIGIKSLLDFKKISEKDLAKNEHYNKKLVKTHIQKINECFEINYILDDTEKQKNKSKNSIWDDESEDDEDEEISIDTDEIDEMEIIKLVKKMLEKIDYELIRNIIDGENFYTIKKVSSSVKNKSINKNY